MSNLTFNPPEKETTELREASPVSLLPCIKTIATMLHTNPPHSICLKMNTSSSMYFSQSYRTYDNKNIIF